MILPLDPCAICTNATLYSKMTQPSEQIPVIDYAALITAGNRSTQLGAIDRACRDHGFFLIENHGLEEQFDDVWQVTQSFFALPRERKRAILRTFENPMGYFDRELTKQKRDQKEIFDFDNEWSKGSQTRSLNQWPDGQRDFYVALKEYFISCTRVAHELVRAVLRAASESIQIADELFGEDHTSFMRLNYDPFFDPLPSKERDDATKLGSMALHHHTDAGGLTVLLQDQVGGLQTLSNSGWIDVEPHENTLVINIGDMIQVFTNDIYKAATHRVLPVASSKSRYSLPLFYNPSPNANIRPLPKSAAAGPIYRPFNWRDFRKARADGDFADYGKEIQISEFKR